MSYYDGSLQFKRFSEKSKKLKFFMTADLLKNVIFFFAYSHVCRFCSQMSEFLLFRYPDVIL